MLIKECKFHVSGPRLTHTQRPEVHKRENTHSRSNTRGHTECFKGLYTHANTCTHTSEGPNQPPLIPFVLGDRDKTVGKADDLMGGKTQEADYTKVTCSYKYVYQYAKRSA